MELSNKEIKWCIEQQLDRGYRRFIIFPFGDVGMQVKNVLKEAYGIEPEYILHSRLWKYNPAIKPLEFLDTISCNELCALLTTIDIKIYSECKEMLQRYFADEAIAELSSMSSSGKICTKIGKYSYGPLCRNHPLIESIGAFSSFAYGTAVVINHPVEYITTHRIIYRGLDYPFLKKSFSEDRGQPHSDELKSSKRINIGNDVWLGQNVIITN